MIRSLLRAGVLLLAFTGWSAPAVAHAMLVESTPADGAHFATAPDAIVLRFNEDVTPITVRLIDSDGKVRAALESPGAAAHEWRLTPGALGDGNFVVSYRVISADAHPVSGALVFSVGAATDVAPAIPDDGADWSNAVIAHRFLTDLIVLLAIGGALFLGAVRPPADAHHRIAVETRLLASLGLVLTLIGLGLKGAQAIGAAPAELLTFAPWRWGAGTSAGAAALIAAIGLASIAVPTRRDDRRRQIGMLGGAAAVAISYALTGHAASASAHAVSAVAIAVHVLAAAFWLGAFRPLLVVLKAPADIAYAAVARFSRIATGMIPLLAVAGVTLAALNLVSVAGLVSSDYGRFVIAKTAVVVILLAIAAYNKWRFTPALAQAARGARRNLARAVRIELLLGALVVAITAPLSQTPPPRDAVMPSAGIAVVAGSSSGRMALIELSPGRTGANTVIVHFTDASGAAYEPKEAAVEIAAPASGVEALRRDLSSPVPYRFERDDLTIPTPGVWTVTVTALIDDFERDRFTAEMNIR